nr:TM0106 family RecB-like putative nuclease [Propionibacterium sp.]
MTEPPFVLDAYAARSCPLKTFHAFTPGLRAPTREVPPPPFFHDADAIEAEVFGTLRDGVDSFIDLRALRGAPSAEQEEAALRSLRERYRLIVGPLLPRDWAGHRSGRPSALLWSGDGYVPVQVKYHRVWEMAGPDDDPVEISPLADPSSRYPLPGKRFRWGGRLNAALQVAHHWRLLEATGHAASRPWAGVVGLERTELPGSRRQHAVITWLDLAAPLAAPDPAAAQPGEPTRVSTLSRYDHEHRVRVVLALRALGAGAEPAPAPVIHRECAYCSWFEHCAGQLDDDDLSKRLAKAQFDPHEVRTLRSLGVTTVADLAAVDLAALLPEYLPRVAHREGGEERLRRAHRRARLIATGVALERTTTGPIPLPEHELEIDLDIETSAGDHAYLWGFHVDDRASGRRYYRSFARFEPMDADAERTLAAEAFEWLRAVTQGRDAAVYHYSSYETIRVHRLAARLAEHGDTDLADWAAAATAEVFVDLFSVVRSHFFGADGLGLKVVATAVSGFRWRDEEPGGLASQTWFSDAVGAATPDERAAARVRVLEYNEDDVRATWHLRAWLRSQS